MNEDAQFPEHLTPGYSSVRDSNLIARAQNGDHSAFRHLVIAYRRRVLAIIYRTIRRPEDVEDVAQEVYLRLYRSLKRLKTTESFEPWLYRLVMNASYDYLRRRRHRNEARMSDLSEQQIIVIDATAAAEASSQSHRLETNKERVESLLRSVSEDDRVLLTLKEIEGFSVKQLATIYSVTETTLKVRLFRARQRLLRVRVMTNQTSFSERRQSSIPKETVLRQQL